MTLLRRREGRRKLGDGPQRRVIAGDDRAMGVDEEHRIAKAAALPDHDGEPAPQASRRP